jgi:hypothetical protein
MRISRLWKKKPSKTNSPTTEPRVRSVATSERVVLGPAFCESGERSEPDEVKSWRVKLIPDKRVSSADMSKQDERKGSMMDLIRKDIEENEELYEALAADSEKRKQARNESGFSE